MNKKGAAEAARDVNHWSDEETTEPLIADDRNYYKVEKWTKDATKVDRMLYAGNNLDKARDVFTAAIRAPTADQADDPPADARVAAVAGEMKKPQPWGPGPS